MSTAYLLSLVGGQYLYLKKYFYYSIISLIDRVWLYYSLLECLSSIFTSDNRPMNYFVTGRSLKEFMALALIFGTVYIIELSWINSEVEKANEKIFNKLLGDIGC